MGSASVVLSIFGAFAAALGVGACIEAPTTRIVAAAIVDICVGINDGALCNDQNTCTTGDTCRGGVCVGVVAPDGTPCTDGNQCTASDVCGQGLCQGSAVSEGTTCTDGEPCTTGDSCRAGLCTAGTPTVCNDGIACTTDTCVLGTGCQFQMMSLCPDGGATDAGGGADGAEAGTGTDGMPADAARDGTDEAADARDGDLPVDAAADTGPDLLGDSGMADGVVGPDGSQADGGDAPEADRDGPRPDGDISDGSAAPDVRVDALPLDSGGADARASFRVEGGACSCEVEPALAPLGMTTWPLLLVALLYARRRRDGAR